MRIAVRVGMSLYWATLEQDEFGWVVEWMQGGSWRCANGRTRGEALGRARTVAAEAS
jgi:hypothetical protein